MPSEVNDLLKQNGVPQNKLNRINIFLRILLCYIIKIFSYVSDHVRASVSDVDWLIHNWHKKFILAINSCENHIAFHEKQTSLGIDPIIFCCGLG